MQKSNIFNIYLGLEISIFENICIAPYSALDMSASYGTQKIKNITN